MEKLDDSFGFLIEDLKCPYCSGKGINLLSLAESKDLIKEIQNLKQRLNQLEVLLKHKVPELKD